MNAKRTEPSRRLCDPNPDTRLEWTHSFNTDIRHLFTAIKRQRLQQQAPNVAQIRKAQK